MNSLWCQDNESLGFKKIQKEFGKTGTTHSSFKGGNADATLETNTEEHPAPMELHSTDRVTDNKKQTLNKMTSHKGLQRKYNRKL